MRDLKTIPVDPENTSSRSPNSRHIKFVGYKNVEVEGGRDLEGREGLLEHRVEGAREVEVRYLEGV
jgi:hypothetical protein